MAFETIIVIILAGVAVGLRGKFLILVPAVAVAMSFAAIVGIAHADQFWSIVGAMIVLGVAGQVGYLAGIAMRAAASSVWAPTIESRNSKL